MGQIKAVIVNTSGKPATAKQIAAATRAAAARAGMRVTGSVKAVRITKK